MPTRREVLALGGVAALTVLTGCFSSGSWNSSSNGVELTPPNRFDPRRALPVPPILAPDADGVLRLRAAPGTAEMIAGLDTPTWGFNGPVLGPTIRANVGDRIRFSVENRLEETTTVHWHGMLLPPEMDGGPHQSIAPGATWRPEWIVRQPAATTWYHPHPHGSTADHVYQGLAGLFLIDDAAPNGLPSEYGVDDIPLILQDRTFHEDGTLAWDTVPHFGLLARTMIVNGAHAPTFTATRRFIRFRVLAGSNARRFNLAFSDDRPFHVIGGEAGLLPVPVEVRTAWVTPGERLEIVASFEPADDVYLQTRSGSYDIDEGDFDLVRVVGAADLQPGIPLPPSLPGPAPLEVPRRATRREFELNGTDEINGQEMSMRRIDAVVPRGAVELWRVRNASDFAHNFHIHGSSFDVLEIDGQSPPAWMAGRKDTVFIAPRSDVLLAVEFADYADEQYPFMFHCHILRHEDKGMMGQFLLVEKDRVEHAPRELDLEDHAH